MNFTLGIGILAAVFLCGCVYFIWRRCTPRHERRGYVCLTCKLPYNPDMADKGLKSGDLDIPVFLRSEGASDNITDNIKINPDIVNIHPWGKTK